MNPYILPPLNELPRNFIPLGFDYNNFHTCEKRMIKPLMERAGYTDIRFVTGERDSFGPLSRVVEARDKAGCLVRFVYY